MLVTSQIIIEIIISWFNWYIKKKLKRFINQIVGAERETKNNILVVVTWDFTLNRSAFVTFVLFASTLAAHGHRKGKETENQSKCKTRPHLIMIVADDLVSVTVGR